MDDLNEKITEALLMMDSMDDDQWTADGSPKVDVVNKLAELEGITRAQILDAAPKFSRENFDVSASEDDEAEEAEKVEENSLGYKHPDIIEAQEAYDEAVANLTKAKKAEREAGIALGEVTDRLMRKTNDRSATTKNVMAAIAASNASRAARVEEFNANRALLTGQAPRSPLDQAKSGEKKVRPKM